MQGDISPSYRALLQLLFYYLWKNRQEICYLQELERTGQTGGQLPRSPEAEDQLI